LLSRARKQAVPAQVYDRMCKREAGKL
jgi:hypothetical protein